jgi:membrane protease YdiL (CAAX protease family)
MMNETTTSTRFGKVFLALFALGLPGVLSLIPTIMTQLDMLPPEMVDMPTAVVVPLLLLNPLILLAISVAIGVPLAHRVGLRSLVAEKVRHGAAIWPDLRPHIPLAFAAGIVFLLVTVGLDWIIDPFANAEFIAEMPDEGDIFSRLLLGVFYGGIVEELMLRWGFMTLLVWLGWRLFQRGQGLPKPALVWTAIVLAALLFGIGHLPGLASLVILTPILVIRTVLLNALGGLIFGWLFWRYNLETAMVSHAAFHIGLFVVNLGILLIGG